MLILTAHNVTPNGNREDGTADYDVWIGINRTCIWRGSVNGHMRHTGAVALLRKIADEMESHVRHRRWPKKKGEPAPADSPSTSSLTTDSLQEN